MESLKMDVLVDLFDEYADKFQRIPMFWLNIGHFIIVTLQLRKRIGLTLAQSNPLACWLSTIIACLSGPIMMNALLGKPLIMAFADADKILMITVIWYFAFFFPSNLFTRIFTSEPVWVLIIIVKEAHRTRGIVDGVLTGIKLYPDNLLIIVVLGFIKGAAGLLADPIAAAIRGSLSFSNNEALKPSFITKISICISIVLTCSLKGILLKSTPLSHLCLAAFLMMATIKVSLFLTGWKDPFVRFENAVSPICFGCPTDTQNTKTKKD